MTSYAALASRPPPRDWPLRRLDPVLALAVAVRAQGWALGLVSYSGHTSLSAALVFGLLIVQARRKGRR